MLSKYLFHATRNTCVYYPRDILRCLILATVLYEEWMRMSTYSSQLSEEQQAVDRAYGRLDDLRTTIRTRLDAVRAAGSHGSPTQRTERDSFATMYEDRLTQLRAVEDRLVFGRLDNTEGTRRYIGRIGLLSENHDPILTDWRAEAARPFYEATPSHHGDIVMRRHITLRFRDVVGIEDEILDIHSEEVGKASQQGTLTGEGALLASLGSRRTGKMTDIVATIQAEQDRIIRAPLDHTIVVQGGPGTGKTAVALHRAAYLLYTHRRKLERSGVLIVGPSSAFLRYIDQVLPSLGETGVVSRTIADLIPDVHATSEDSAYVAKLKGMYRMHTVIAHAISGRIRVPKNLPTLHIGGFSIPLLKEDIQIAQSDAQRTHQPHNQARNTFVKTVLSILKNRYLQQLDYNPDQAELNDITSQLRLDDKLRITLNLAWLPMTGEWLIDQLFSKPDQLRTYAPWLSEDDIAALVRPKGSPLTRSDIPLLDEAMELLGPDPKLDAQRASARAKKLEEQQFASDTLAQAGIGNGIVTADMLLDNLQGDDAGLLARKAASDREWTYGHVVVDEAQELTAMDWRMLIRRCPSRSFTIVGDVAQTSALGGTHRWQKNMNTLFGEPNWDLYELTINYRNPREVSEAASKVATDSGLYISTVNAVRSVPGSLVTKIVESDENLDTELAQSCITLFQKFVSDDGSGRIVVIAPCEMIKHTQDVVNNALRNSLPEHMIRRLDEQNEDDKQCSVCTAEDVKGLEYDAVIVLQPSQIEQEAASRLAAAANLYVAMTRPTQQLFIIRTSDDANFEQ